MKKQTVKKQFAIPEEITGAEIKAARRRMDMTQAEFAAFANVSKKTIERWETSDAPVGGPIVSLLRVVSEFPQVGEHFRIPEKKYPLRLSYMCGDDVCTIIDVDERKRLVEIHNYAEHFMMRAFGVNEKPTFEQYEEFLESRCFPRTRDKMKLHLRALDLPFYDPFMIIEKTEGRMAEDDFWIKIER